MNIDLREENLSAYKDSFGLHYSSILAYLSTCFNDSVIVDLERCFWLLNGNDGDGEFKICFYRCFFKQGFFYENCQNL